MTSVALSLPRSEEAFEKCWILVGQYFALHVSLFQDIDCNYIFGLFFVKDIGCI